MIYFLKIKMEFLPNASLNFLKKTIQIFISAIYYQKLVIGLYFKQ